MTSSSVTRMLDGAARAAVEVRLEGLSRHFGPVVALTFRPDPVLVSVGSDPAIPPAGEEA